MDVRARKRLPSCSDVTAYTNLNRILRPAFFMENFDGTIGNITTTVLRVGLKPTTKLQLIASVYSTLLVSVWFYSHGIL